MRLSRASPREASADRSTIWTTRSNMSVAAFLWQCGHAVTARDDRSGIPGRHNVQYGLVPK